jgi:hypothetical protein
MKNGFAGGVGSWRVLPDELRNIQHVLQHLGGSFIAQLPLENQFKG